MVPSANRTVGVSFLGGGSLASIPERLWYLLFRNIDIGFLFSLSEEFSATLAFRLLLNHLLGDDVGFGDFVDLVEDERPANGSIDKA